MKQLNLPFLNDNLDLCELLDSSQKPPVQAHDLIHQLDSSQDLLSFPPPFTIKKTARAKRMGLQVSAERGLVVIVPARLRYPRIDAFLNEHRVWIEKNFDIIGKHQARKNAALKLPTRLMFKAIYKTIILEYARDFHKETSSYSPLSNPIFSPPETNANPDSFFPNELSSSTNTGQPNKTIPSNSVLKRIRLQPVSENLYQILGPTHNKVLVFRSLRQFVMQQAKAELLPWLQALSLETGLSYHSAIIRRQTTLWGSCNARHKISLNMKLLFLEPALARYVILHELCHTRQLNHSIKFWNLLQKFDPQAKLHRKQLAQISDLEMPPWL